MSDISIYGTGENPPLAPFIVMLPHKTNNFNIGGNASFNKIEDLDDLTQRTYNVAFNTPEWRYNITLKKCII